MSLARSLLADLRKVEVTGTRTAQAIKFLRDFSQRPEMLEEFRPPTEEELRAHSESQGALPAAAAPAAPSAPRTTR